ncbi:MAG: ATP-binding protein [Cyanobacteria bacterium P01_D01_bin.156]
MYQIFPGKYSGYLASTEEHAKLPKFLVAIIFAVCLLPFLLNLLGADFGTVVSSLDVITDPELSTHQLTETVHHILAGSYIHTILEWSAFCAAIFTVVLAFAHFWITQDITTPIIGITLFCAGMMDAFHTLAADRLVEAVADNRNLIPFTWALCRMLNAVLTIIGVSLLLSKRWTQWKNKASFVAAVSLLFGLLAYVIIRACATSHALPQTMFPNSFITRPWDVIPLVLYVIAGLIIYPLFYRTYPSLFSYSLVVGVVPNVATQMHMAFGSTALFDNNFNIAHFLKIIAYIVPLTGLILDYIHTYQTVKLSNQALKVTVDKQQETEIALRQSENALTHQNHRLQEAFVELRQTQMQLIQTEKMSSLGQLVAGVAHEINNPVNFIHGNVTHINNYTQDLLEVIQAYKKYYSNPPQQLQMLIEDVDLDFIQEDLGKSLQSMHLGTNRIRDIVLSLRNFSRLDEAALKDVDLHEGIDNTLLLLMHRLKANDGYPAIQVMKNYGQLPLVDCYPGQLNQVFMNLFANAIDILEESSRQQEKGQKIAGCIDIETQVIDKDWVQITIADNGPGMPDNVRMKIFDPFFTTKPVGKGTGLGLSISHQIITENHKGKLQCNSSEKGTEFVVQIPSCQSDGV